MHIIIGLIIMAAGFFLVAKSEWMLNNFGRIGFFDKYLGSSGGTRLGYKMFGIVILFVSILILTNMIGAFVAWIVSPLTKHSPFM